MQRPAIAPIESSPIIPVFSHGLLYCEVRDVNVEFVLYLDQIHAEGGLERLVNHRHIIPIAGVAQALPHVISKLPMASIFAIGAATRRLLAGHGLASS